MDVYEWIEARFRPRRRARRFEGGVRFPSSSSRNFGGRTISGLRPRRYGEKPTDSPLQFDATSRDSHVEGVIGIERLKYGPWHPGKNAL
jgi:hypothetical protein